jgi:hypothetical protein
MSNIQPILYTEAILPNIQSNTKTKYDRVIKNITLRRILFETYDTLEYERTLTRKGVKTDKYKIALQSIYDQKDILLNVYDQEYDNECYTDQDSMMDNYYKPPMRPHFESLDPKKNIPAVREYVNNNNNNKNLDY